MGIRIVTDSTCDLGPEAVDRLGVSVVPLKVHFGERTYTDGKELSPAEFYSMLQKSEVLPKTSQPSPTEFEKVYRELTRDGSSVISIHLSSKLSGTYQSGVMAKEMLPNADIEVIDSRLASLGMALIVRQAALMAQSGVCREEIVERTKLNALRCHTYFVVETLEYLFKNGRIGKAAHLMGSLLSLKPILALEEGVVVARDKVRGRAKALERVVDIAAGDVVPGSKVQAAICHANAPEAAAALRERVARLYNVEFWLEGMIGSVIGSHVGPGTVGVILLESV
ncbi:MAG TPA: DegV family protein [Firmicutes bacterium]|nr:DegV family protein [Bacillota bacterium]